MDLLFQSGMGTGGTGIQDGDGAGAGAGLDVGTEQLLPRAPGHDPWKTKTQNRETKPTKNPKPGMMLPVALVRAGEEPFWLDRLTFVVTNFSQEL